MSNLREPEDFIKEFLDEIYCSIWVHILEPLPAEVRPELLKKVQSQVLTQKWSGKNDIKLFRNWIHAWLAWMSSSGWKGPAFNEVHVQNLSSTVDGNVHDLVMHYVRQGVQSGKLPIFWDLLKILICMYIKKSAAIASTRTFKTLAYDSAKGVKHFYMQLLRAAEDMITVPDQASFNKHFLNTLPSDIRCKLVLCDQVSMDFTTKDLLWSAVL